MKIKIRLFDMDDDGNVINASEVADALAVSCGGTWSTSGAAIGFIECDESQGDWLIEMINGDDRISEYEVIE